MLNSSLQFCGAMRVQVWLPAAVIGVMIGSVLTAPGPVEKVIKVLM